MFSKINEEEEKKGEQVEVKTGKKWEIEEPTDDLNGLTVVDLENLLDEAASGHTAVDSEWDSYYDYFLCVKKNGRIEEPFAPAK